jgi:plasmid stabilization system protein ParE
LVRALRQHFARLATIPGLYPRARCELYPDTRGVAFGDVRFNAYLIFFRYVEETFEVVQDRQRRS